MATEKPQSLPFLLRALGYYIHTPLQPQQGASSNVPVQPISPMWDTGYLSSRSYFIQIIEEDHPPPVPGTGGARAILEYQLQELPEFTDEQVKSHYDRIMGNGYPWADLDVVIKRGHCAGELIGDEWKEWNELHELHIKYILGTTQGQPQEDVDERAVLNDILLWAVAVDHRWNFPGTDGIIEALAVPELTLMFEWYMLKIYVNNGGKHRERQDQATAA